MSPSAAIASTQEPLVIVPSDILGELTVPEDQVLNFPTGLLGFPECQSFLLLPTERNGIYWLQSVEYSALAFVLADPFIYFEGHSIDLEPGDVEDLQADDRSQLIVLAIVTLPRTRGQKPTANLQGPLAINLATRRGKQLALQGVDVGVRCPFDLSWSDEQES